VSTQANKRVTRQRRARVFLVEMDAGRRKMEGQQI
jgi:hypothetical protein